MDNTSYLEFHQDFYLIWLPHWESKPSTLLKQRIITVIITFRLGGHLVQISQLYRGHNVNCMCLTTTHARCGVFYVVRRRSSSKRSYVIKPEVPLSLSTFSHFDNVRSCGTLLHRGFAGSEAWSPALEGSCWIPSCPFTWVLHARCFWKEDCLKNRRIYVAVRRGQGPC